MRMRDEKQHTLNAQCIQWSAFAHQRYQPPQLKWTRHGRYIYYELDIYDCPWRLTQEAEALLNAALVVAAYKTVKRARGDMSIYYSGHGQLIFISRIHDTLADALHREIVDIIFDARYHLPRKARRE